MQYLVHNVKLPIDSSETKLANIAAKRIGCGREHIRSLQIVRKSLDARSGRVGWVYSVIVDLKSKGNYILRRSRRRQGADIRPYKPSEAPKITPLEDNSNFSGRGEIVIIGSGPAGMFAALVLAEAGYRPLVIERGDAIENRELEISKLLKKRQFNPESNFLFGLGGAGTYSDGKLYSRIGDGLGPWVLQRFVEFGADRDILTNGRPHIGSEVLPIICRNMRYYIESLGGRFMFNSRVDSLELVDGSVHSIILADSTRIDVSSVILAIGHSARDTFEMLNNSGVAIEAKPFQMGLRIEHPQELIDSLQLGQYADRPELCPADYHLIAKDAGGVADVYSFCMCPGGAVLPSHSEADTICSNGGSRHDRDSGFANSALVMTVRPENFGDDALSGLEFQRAIEREAFKAAGGDYTMAAQNVSDFLSLEKTSSVIPNSSLTGAEGVNFHDFIPEPICAAIGSAMGFFDNKLPGFAGEKALLLGPETRASGPVRIVRDRQRRCSPSASNLYPVGEGAGYAGGIMSSAIDAIHSASTAAH